MGIKGQKRTVYTAEFKLEALQLCKQPNGTIESVAQELGVPYKTLLGWKKAQAEKGSQAVEGQGGSQTQHRIGDPQLHLQNVLVVLRRSIHPAVDPRLYPLDPPRPHCLGQQLGPDPGGIHLTAGQIPPVLLEEALEVYRHKSSVV